MKRLFIVLLFATISCSTNAKTVASTCYGTTKHGRLENSVKLPGHGKNFTTYSTLAGMLGRTYVHSKVYETVIDAYKLLETESPRKVYKYAETGYQNGGIFKPHKTHQNGLSIDFITPVTENGQSVHLPTHALNKYGYSIEFNQHGQYKQYSIDYEALAAHIVSLHKAALKNNIGIWRIIFDPKLQAGLFNTKYANYIKNNIQLSTKRSWVRHDEHYHVDFVVQCKPL